jgi:hypothetical protein
VRTLELINTCNKVTLPRSVSKRTLSTWKRLLEGDTTLARHGGIHLWSLATREAEARGLLELRIESSLGHTVRPVSKTNKMTPFQLHQK